MANNKSALKRIKTAQRNYDRNIQRKTLIKSYIKKTLTAIEEKDENLSDIFKTTVKTIDTIAQKKIIHKNKAARLKSRLSKKIQAISN